MCARAEGGWGHLVVELACRIVILLTEPDRKGLHAVSRVWRDAVRLSTTQLAPRSLDTGRMKQAFPGVRELVLKGLELNPRDMLHLGGLSTLATLRLLGCSLEHSASMLALAALTQLEGLELRRVQGVGPEVVDDVLCKLTALTALQVECRMPQSRVPQLCHLSNLASLRELSIRQAAVYVHVLGLTQLGALTLLQGATLEGVLLDGGMLQQLAAARGLTRLHIPGAHMLPHAALAHLQELTALCDIDLSIPRALFEAIPITNHGIAHLATLQQLTRLSLAGRSGVTAQGLVWLSARTGLCHLDLRMCQLCIGDASFLWGLTRLTLLSVSSSDMLGPSFQGIARLAQLQDLDVGGTAFDDAACSQLRCLTGLTRLDLSYTCMTNSGLLCLPCRLRRLGIEGCRVSVLGVAAVLRAHRGVVLWSPAAVHVPRLLNVVHVLLLARPSNGQPSYALRARFAPEESRAQALLVYAGLAGFLSRYLLGLVAAAAWLALLPLLSLAAALFLLAAMLAGATATLARCQRLSHGLEGLLVGLLLGLHRPETGPDGNWE